MITRMADITGTTRFKLERSILIGESGPKPASGTSLAGAIVPATPPLADKNE